jgi:hypothetical protein
VAVRELIHFALWVQLTSHSLFPSQIPPDPVAESPLKCIALRWPSPGRVSSALVYGRNAHGVCQYLSRSCEQGKITCGVELRQMLIAGSTECLLNYQIPSLIHDSKQPWSI